MGSPLGPTLANVSLCHFEEQCTSDCPVNYKFISYRRYVNDTFLLLLSALHATKYLNYMSSKHRTLSLPSSVKKIIQFLFSIYNIFFKVGNFTHQFTERLHLVVF